MCMMIKKGYMKSESFIRRKKQIDAAKITLSWFEDKGLVPTYENIKSNWPKKKPIEIARILQIYNNGNPVQFGDIYYE